MLFKVFNWRTAKVRTDPGDDLRSGEQAGGLANGPLAMHPVELNRIEPRTFDGPAPDGEADASMSFGLLMVGPDPRANLSTDVPGGMVP
jgi:hypothetical protein